MPDEIIHSYELTIRLIKRDLPKRNDAPAGYHEAEYYTQYLSEDGFILNEHRSTADELSFFKHVQKLNDTQECLL